MLSFTLFTAVLTLINRRAQGQQFENITGNFIRLFTFAAGLSMIRLDVDVIVHLIKQRLIILSCLKDMYGAHLVDLITQAIFLTITPQV